MDDAAWIYIPRGFLIDHEERELPTPDYKECGRRTYVRRDDPNLPELISDAKHYAHGGTDAEPWIVNSAKALLAALAKATGSEGGR